MLAARGTPGAAVATRPGATYPTGTGGAHAAPPENCGGPWAFLIQQQSFSASSITQRRATMLTDADAPISDYLEELHDLPYGQEQTDGRAGLAGGARVQGDDRSLNAWRRTAALLG
ncbi:MAG: plasmid pRiA4b ORF-3 family protein [Chloroflexales bacterium]|nr:plasmid pRiA4b ORF-3 family protein [Chloroflexales bacterium]